MWAVKALFAAVLLVAVLGESVPEKRPDCQQEDDSNPDLYVTTPALTGSHQALDDGSESCPQQDAGETTRQKRSACKKKCKKCKKCKSECKCKDGCCCDDCCCC